MLRFILLIKKTIGKGKPSPPHGGVEIARHFSPVVINAMPSNITLLGFTLASPRQYGRNTQISPVLACL